MAHCLTVHRLFAHELIPKLQQYAPATFNRQRGADDQTRDLTAINGMGRTARNWVDLIERLTGQQSLSVLTMLPWRRVLAERLLLRRTRAWCPRCFDELKRNKRIVYEPLSWTLTAVEICIDHAIKLQTKCPHCQRMSLPLSGTLIPGRCSRCLGWLGSSSLEMSDSQAKDKQYELWVAKQLGQLIEEAYQLDDCPSPRRFSNFLATYPDHVCNGNATSFARFLGISPQLYHRWRFMKKVPHINCLLKVCHRSSIPLPTLLTSDCDDPEAIKRLFILVARSDSHQQKTRTALLTALSEDPVPSVQQVLRRLGSKDVRSLYTYHSELCKALTAKYRYTRRKRAPPRPARIRRAAADGAEIRAALQDALNERPFPALREVARRLGYVSEAPLKSRFPDLCRILVSRSERVKPALERALLEPTPPTLIDVARSLGYAHETALRTRYPEMCGELVARRKKYRAQQLNQIGKTLQSMLLINPAPTLNEVAERLGYKVFKDCKDSLLKYFPELYGAIKGRLEQQRKLAHQQLTILMDQAVQEYPPPSLKEVTRRTGHVRSYISMTFPIQREAIKARHRDFQRKLAAERKAEAKSRIKQMALEPNAAGVFPTLTEIARAYKANVAIKGSELLAVLRELRQENGIK